MAPQPDTRYRWAAAVLHQLGIHQTPGGVATLAGWARSEGGHWHNDARFNPLNTTLDMPGAGNTGTQGNIKQYRNWRQGIEATAKTLESGRYAGIRRALAAGDPAAAAAAIAASPWDVAHYQGRDLRGILTATPKIAGVRPLGGGGGGTRVGDGSGGAARHEAALSPAIPNLQSGVDLTGLLGQMSQGSGGPPVSLPQAPAHAAQPVLPQGYQSPVSSAIPSQSQKPSLQDMLALVRSQGGDVSTPGAAGAQEGLEGAQAAAPGGKVQGFKPGRPVVSGKSVGGVHETSGLPGFPARDYFAKPGSTTVAPVSGEIIKLSGHDPKQGPTQGPHGPLGYSVYIKGADGRTYFLTHLGSRTVRVGQTVQAGQQIGTVANYDKYGTPSHIHMGVHG